MRHGVHRVIYDDGCAFCVQQMRWLRRLDWLRRFHLVPRSHPEAAGPGIMPEALAQAIHCITAHGRVLRGAAALRFVGLRLPLTAPLSVVFWLPGALALAEQMYDWVRCHRHAWSGRTRAPSRCDTACPPGRDRSG